MNNMNPKVDFFFNKADKWQDEFEKLRTIVLDCGLTEELKWGVPCYTFQQKNVILLGAFKQYSVLSFFKGALLHDAHAILTLPGENTQAGRVIRFTEVHEIIKIEKTIKEYIFEAIEIEKAALKVPLKNTSEYPFPTELHHKFDEIPTLKTAFEALTPGRQRGYLLHFSAPKQAKTRMSRIEKCMPLIFQGKGLNDNYTL